MEELREKLFSLADEKYKEFHGSLCPGTNNIIGIRVPILRNLAGSIAKEDWREYLKNAKDDYYEEVMLQGMVIGLAKMEFDERIEYVKEFIPKIDNWAVCDVTCAGFKFTKKNMEEVWKFLKPYLASNKEFEIRFAVVMLLDFYITEEYLLRTQTSSVQARTMMANKEKTPIRVICPGKTYRRDDDATHSHQFGQIEGLVIDEGISLAHLKGTLEVFVRHMLGEDSKLRFRPSYFPFTEPSYEVDVSCFKCGGKGCNLCKQTGWIEILGSGMVHPNVLKMNGYAPEKYSGFAFGTGLDRLAMFKYGIPDIRLLYANDVRFLNQFDRKD